MATPRPSGRTLPEIRRGGLEGLGARLARGELRPDFGPARLHPAAGALVIGARDFLIAFNVNLATDLRAARRIAARVRDPRNAPRPTLRAIGVELRDSAWPDGAAQVSMNLLDYRATSLRDAFDRVAGWANRWGIPVLGAEIVGLPPRDATWPGIEADLKLAGPPRTLEEALAVARVR